jgi:BMFP domain-containing protein YqiC
VALALPVLESMQAPFGRAAGPPPRRMFCICNNLGVLPDRFFPRDTGRDFTPSPYLTLLQEHRADFTVLSGVSHPGVDGGHPSDICFLTAAPHPASSSFRNSISLDQLVAERIGTLTRFPSLTLAVNGGRSLSWTSSGVAIPPEGQASRVFNQLFLQGTRAEIEAQIREIDTGRSILDAVAGQARDLQRQVGARDRNRLDQYFASVRDLEHRLQESRGWAGRPKPRVNASPPTDPASPAQYMAKVRIMYDLARLAFETDSTRAITLMLNSVATPVVQLDGATITDSYHNLSHHGMAQEKAVAAPRDRRMAHAAPGRPAPGPQVRARRRRHAPGPHHGPVRLEPGGRQRALDDEPANPVCRRRLSARPAPGLRPRPQLPAAEPIRVHAAPDGD